ncbi:MAG: hypothetical protein MGG37_22970, partial [Trichodesmium sp. MAG_R01]|nr:hypothetical protein [Trichodesmium sp. MAG_R01]
LAIAGRRLIGYNMAQLYSIVTPNLTGTKLSLDSLYELALKALTKIIPFNLFLPPLSLLGTSGAVFFLPIHKKYLGAHKQQIH